MQGRKVRVGEAWPAHRLKTDVCISITFLKTLWDSVSKCKIYMVFDPATALPRICSKQLIR